MQEKTTIPHPVTYQSPKTQEPTSTSLHYLHLPTRQQFQQKGWVHKSKIIYICNESSTWIKNTSTNISISIHIWHHHSSTILLHLNNYSNNFVATSHQQQLLPTRLCDDFNYASTSTTKCNMHVVPFYERWMTSIPGHEPSTIGWLKHPRA